MIIEDLFYKRKHPLPQKRKRKPAGRKLSLKQRRQIGIRKVTDKQLHWAFPLVFAIVFFALMLVTSKIPYKTVKPDASDYKNQSMQLTFTGDTVISRYIQQLADKNGYDSLFEDVKAVWQNSDYVFTNLEYSILVKDESEYEKTDKKVNLGSTVESVQALKDAGVNVIGYANNHTSDYGDAAFLDAITWLEDNDFNFSGYFLDHRRVPDFENNATAMKLYTEYKEVPYEVLECANGKKVGFISTVDQATSITGLSNYVLRTTNSNLYKNINLASHNTDLSVVYVHCGTEYSFVPEETQRTTAHNMIDAGADIVIESHSHTLMPVEFYGKGIIFYGMGNFIMDQYQSDTRDSVIVQYNEDEEDGGYFEIIPLRINNGYTQITGSDYYISRINRNFTKYLSSSQYKTNSRGHIIIPWTKE